MAEDQIDKNLLAPENQVQQTSSESPVVTSETSSSAEAAEIQEAVAEAESEEPTANETAATSGEQFDMTAYESTRAIITRQVEQLEELKNKSKLYKEQMASLFENNESLNQAEKQAKELTKDLKDKRTAIMQSSEAKTIKMHIRDLREEQKEIEESLSNHLFDLYQTTGVTEFEGLDGSVWEYDIKAKLKAKKSS